MSGHSKWAGIKHRKGATDAKRGKVFTRHAKLIEIAAREGGGGDPESNARLRTAIDNAKADNVPNDNIDRAIRKGTGELRGESQTVAVTYEAFGPAGTAYLIDCLTDNRNRTLPAIRAILARNGGRIAESGSVGWMFEQKGIVVAVGGERRSAGNREELELKLIDAGALDIDERDEAIVVTTSRECWPKIRDILKGAGYGIQDAGLSFIPKQPVPVSNAASAQKILGLMEALEADDDVTEVHTNAEISETAARTLL